MDGKRLIFILSATSELSANARTVERAMDALSFIQRLKNGRNYSCRTLPKSVTSGFFTSVPCNRIVTGTFKLPDLLMKRLPSIEDFSNTHGHEVSGKSMPIELPKDYEEGSSEEDMDPEEREDPISPVHETKKPLKQQTTGESYTSISIKKLNEPPQVASEKKQFSKSTVIL